MTFIVKEKVNQKYPPVDSFEIEESALKKIYEELGETPETRADCLKSLRKTLHEMKDLEPNVDDVFLLAFLRVAKFDCSKALDRMLNYFRLQDKYLDYFRDCSFTTSKLEHLHHLKLLPYKLDKNLPVLVSRQGIIDYSKVSVEERCYSEMLLTTQAVTNPMFQLAGCHMIYDYKGFGFRSFVAQTPRHLKMALDIFVNTYPVRIKAMHVTNAPTLFHALFNLIYPLLSKKTQNRVFFHYDKDNWQSLHSHIPPEILPEEYGGDLKESSLIDSLKDLAGFEEHFLKLFKFGFIKNKKRRQEFSLLT